MGVFLVLIVDKKQSASGTVLLTAFKKSSKWTLPSFVAQQRILPFGVNSIDVMFLMALERSVEMVRSFLPSARSQKCKSLM